MSSPVILTNGAREGDVPPHRDVKNHMLFEVSTEAANRGLCSTIITLCALVDALQSAESIQSSSQKHQSPPLNMEIDIP